MNATAEILACLQAIDEELHELLQTPMHIETAEQRLQRARNELVAHCGGTPALHRIHTLAVEDLYADQAKGHSLD